MTERERYLISLLRRVLECDPVLVQLPPELKDDINEAVERH